MKDRSGPDPFFPLFGHWLYERRSLASDATLLDVITIAVCFIGFLVGYWWPL